MNILVLGGSYFLGRYFVNLAYEKHNLFVFNRGTCPLNMTGVTEIKGDRHNGEDLKKLSEYSFDAVVDFCGYSEGDISNVLKALQTTPKQYVFISTVDAYTRGLGSVLAEDAPLESRYFGGPEGDYISGKVALENEIRNEAEKYGFKYTVFRPAFIYGPGNYAPREGIYFNWIAKAGQILHPKDATGVFQFVYVMDVARAVFASLGNEDAYDEAFNLTGKRVENYESFAETLSKVSPVPFERVDIDLETVFGKGIPLPFPLTGEESNLYKGDKALRLIGEYTDFEEGMKRTVRMFFNN